MVLRVIHRHRPLCVRCVTMARSLLSAIEGLGSSGQRDAGLAEGQMQILIRRSEVSSFRLRAMRRANVASGKSSKLGRPYCIGPMIDSTFGRYFAKFHRNFRGGRNFYVSGNVLMATLFSLCGVCRRLLRMFLRGDTISSLTKEGTTFSIPGCFSWSSTRVSCSTSHR